MFPLDAVFSPDGQWVAYQKGSTGVGEATVYLQPFPPNGKVYEIARGGRPAWSRDGRELFFVPRPGQFDVVKVMSRPTVAFSAPASVTRGFGISDPITARPYDPMPNGRIVGVGAVPQIGPTGLAQIQVVLNWLDELKARVPTK